jgi:hypothetical protein
MSIRQEVRFEGFLKVEASGEFSLRLFPSHSGRPTALFQRHGVQRRQAVSRTASARYTTG